ncbi:MAG: hypothetical protein KC656_03225, partial [Myxococcales bacterium]|nr:hypothetical protein [Myxococcales bacterium]
GSLEATVEAQAAALAEARQAIAELTTIVNNHADLLDGQAEDLATLDRDTQLVRDMQGMVSVQDGQLRIEDANLVLIQGADADGKPRENGRILTQPAVLAGR